MGPRNILIAVILGIALAAGIGVALRMTDGLAGRNDGAPASPLTTATVLPFAKPLPEFSLLDQYSHPVGRDSFKGQWDLVFFGFTNCPDICPLTLQVLSRARTQLREQGLQALPRIVLVSVDPERDSPGKIGEYVAYFGSENLGVTGDIDELRKLTDDLGIFFQKVPMDGEGYAVDHTSAVLVVDPEGRFRALFGGPHTVENFIDDLPLIMASE